LKHYKKKRDAFVKKENNDLTWRQAATLLAKLSDSRAFGTEI
jgi:hypothetical protein